VNVHLPEYLTEGSRPRALSQPAPIREMLPEAPARGIKKRLSVPALPRCEEILECPPTPPADTTAEDDKEEEAFKVLTPDSGTSSHIPQADTSISESEGVQCCEELSPARETTSEAEAKSPFLTEIQRIFDDSPDEDAVEK
jgi:hypothetical protein